ncbi:unnamed protein product [Trifolium pratense]|uniref:Uncharacterized protein n=1 Tax=Trifolium pratense TaxID=57577 RepID=A0ACB0ILE0_TRIPR|nr:unnamed protein product [Trifolium pratense]
MVVTVSEVELKVQAMSKKKTTISRSWILLNRDGRETVLDVDKYAIMRLVEIHARDLRIMDPLLSYPSTILGREKVIVLNLEHIKAIITAEEVLVRDPLDDDVVPVVEELRRRLPLRVSGQGQGEEESCAQDSEENEIPFEFRALEVILEGICSFLDARTKELETAAYPALDELTSKISSRNLDKVRKLKSAMTRLTNRVHKAYFIQIDGTLNKLTTVREYIDDTEDYINIQLDNHRNQLIQLELFLSSGTVCFSIYSLVAAIFGMNIPYTWNKDHGYVFKWVVILTAMFCGSFFLSIVSYARRKGLVGS